MVKEKDHYTSEDGYNTEVYYIYRDGANYKLYFYEVLPGVLPPETIEKILEMTSCEPFYPARFGFSAETFVDLGYKPYDDDPDYHELMNIETVKKTPTHTLTAEEFAKKLQEEM